MVYVSTAAVPQDRLRDDQYQRLTDYRKVLEPQGLLWSYQGVEDLRQQLMMHITSVVSELLQKERGRSAPGAATVAATSVVTAPRPDVRVSVYAAERVPPVPGIKHLVGIRIENHSPVVVFISAISIVLKGNRALLLARDVATGRTQSRVPLRPGETLQWSTDGDSLLRDVPPDDVVGVSAYDDINREFKEPEGTLRRILGKWAEKGAVDARDKAR
jgi:hypothetical protein